MPVPLARQQRCLRCGDRDTGSTNHFVVGRTVHNVGAIPWNEMKTAMQNGKAEDLHRHVFFMGFKAMEDSFAMMFVVRPGDRIMPA